MSSHWSSKVYSCSLTSYFSNHCWEISLAGVNIGADPTCIDVPGMLPPVRLQKQTLSTLMIDSWMCGWETWQVGTALRLRCKGDGTQLQEIHLSLVAFEFSLISATFRSKSFSSPAFSVEGEKKEIGSPGWFWFYYKCKCLHSSA